jgi:selenocysteine-specific elongation factor
MRANRHIIVGTAGHVDHGKTELVKALTGVNTDRLKEEQERGISIELGFAELVLPSGDRVGLVDVPGHERFVKAMVAGAAGMDLGLLIVAADEGVMPQTREHLEVLSWLDLTGGVIAITKSDLADEEMLDLVEADIDSLVKDTFLEAAPRVRVSARTGSGLEALRAALDSVTARLPARPSETFFRLPVDRVFTLPGVGLLVTGTAWAGRVKEGDSVVILPVEREARVRGIQVHGEKRETAFAGERIALNLHGLKTDDIERGMMVVTPGALRPSWMLDVTLGLSKEWERPLANRTRLRIHHGAAELFGRAILLDRDVLSPGESAPAQLRLESPLAADRGDRLVLRQYSPMRTLGGAIVLDPQPSKHKRFRDDVLETLALQERGGPEERVHDAVRRAGLNGITLAELQAARLIPADSLADVVGRLAGEGSVQLVGDAYVDTPQVELAMQDVQRLANEFQRANPLARGIGRAELQERLAHRGTKARFGELLEVLSRLSAGTADAIHVRSDAVRVGSPERQLDAGDRASLEKLESLLRAGSATPPTVTDLQAKVGLGGRMAGFLKMLEDSGAVVRVGEGLYYHRSALDLVEGNLRAWLSSHPALTMSDFKELTGLSRKFAVPLLEYFDRRGLTLRRGDERVPGPMMR